MQGLVLAPAKSLDAMSRIVFNDRLNAALCALFMFVVLSVLVYSVKTVLKARAERKPSSQELPFQTLPAAAHA